MFDLKPLRTLAAAGLLALMAGGASAATCNIANFTTSTDCVANVPNVPPGGGGNVRVQEMNAGAGVFGRTGWRLLASIGDVDGEQDPQNSNPFLFSFTYLTFNDAGDPLSGTWALNPLFRWGTGSFAFAIKGSTNNAVYLMSKLETSGTWNIFDLQGSFLKPGLSNVRLFGTTDLAPIPLPAAGFLMLGALGGLGLLSRRRRKAA